MDHPTQPDLTDRTVVITGGSRGIGAATAAAAARVGANVVIASRKQELLDGVAAEIREDGGTCLPIACHTGHPDEVTDLFARARDEFGSVHGLVNNAATNPHFGPMLDISWPAFDKTVEINVKGYLAPIMEFMRERGEGTGGAVVSVASIAGQSAAPLQGVYGMTKAAVISMMQTLAVEYAWTGVRFNAVSPGLVETRLAAALIENEDIHERVVGSTALGRHAQPDEIAGMIVFLLSDAASYMTGQNVTIDGGATLTGL